MHWKHELMAQRYWKWLHKISIKSHNLKLFYFVGWKWNDNKKKFNVKHFNFKYILSTQIFNFLLLFKSVQFLSHLCAAVLNNLSFLWCMNNCLGQKRIQEVDESGLKYIHTNGLHSYNDDVAFKKSSFPQIINDTIATYAY